jgi:hypothetical protein
MMELVKHGQQVAINQKSIESIDKKCKHDQYDFENRSFENVNINAKLPPKKPSS